METLKLCLDNIWTHIEPSKILTRSIIQNIEDNMSYVIQEYVRRRKTYVDFKFSLLDKDLMRYPSGLTSNLIEVLKSNNIDFEIQDIRQHYSSNSSLELHEVKLRDYQEESIEKSIQAERGIIKVATGGGKTVIGIGIVGRLNLKTLFIVNSLDLLEQAYDEFSRILKVPIGRIGGGYLNVEKINICTIQTLHSALGLKYEAVDEECYFKEKVSKKILEKKEEIKKVIEEAEVIVQDECFKADTPILVDLDKQVTIKDVYENSIITHVISFNHEKQIYEKKKILYKFKRPTTDKWYKVTIKIQDKIIIIHCTKNHKFWTKNRGYVKAIDLLTTDILKYNDLNHDEAQVISVKYLYSASNKSIKNNFRYNLEIEDNHNYFANNILVSNCQHSRSSSYVNMMKHAKSSFYKIGLCLHGSTKIHLSDGRECQIESLYNFASKNNPNKIINVLTFNLKKEIIESKKAKIIRTRAKNKKLYKITVKDKNNNLKEIVCSSEHKFFSNNKFVKAENLKINSQVNLIEKIKKQCSECKKEIPTFRKQCSRECSLKAAQKVMKEGHKKWWNSLPEKEKIKRSHKFQQAGTQKAIKSWNNKTEEEKEIKRKKCRQSQKMQKKKNPEKYYADRLKGTLNGWANPKRISKVSKKMWSKLNKQQRHDRNIPWIRSGIQSQIKMRKARKLGKYSRTTKALDKHICDSKQESFVDNWLYNNKIKHKIHSNIPGTSNFSDFLVKHENKDFYIEYDGLNRKKYHKVKLYERLGLNYIIVKFKDLDKLNEKLGFLLFKDPIGIVVKKEIIENKEKWLYDLTILNVKKENQNFFANSILVHNSATPYRLDSTDIILNAYSGKEIVNIDASYLIDRGFLVKPTIYFLDPNELSKYKFLKQQFQTIYKNWIIENENRNNLIVSCAERLMELDKTVLITVTRIEHGNILTELIEKNLKGVPVAFIRGEVDKLKRKELLNDIRSKKLKILVGTSVADEGLDLPALDSAIIAGGGKSLIKTLQRVGRTLRPYPSAENNLKKEAIIVDFYDHLRYLTGQSMKRMKIYSQEKRFEIRKYF